MVSPAGLSAQRRNSAGVTHGGTSILDDSNRLPLVGGFGFATSIKSLNKSAATRGARVPPSIGPRARSAPPGDATARRNFSTPRRHVGVFLQWQG